MKNKRLKENNKKRTLRLYGPLYGWSKTFCRLQTEVSGIHLIKLRRRKDRVNLGATSDFEP